jgi:hypothetical protein
MENWVIVETELSYLVPVHTQQHPDTEKLLAPGRLFRLDFYNCNRSERMNSTSIESKLILNRSTGRTWSCLYTYRYLIHTVTTTGAPPKTPALSALTTHATSLLSPRQNPQAIRATASAAQRPSLEVFMFKWIVELHPVVIEKKVL